MRLIHVVTAFLAGILVACSHSPGPVPLSGPPADVAALEGQWAGQYHSYDSPSRSGTIYFRLDAGQDTARGDVLMRVGGRETVDAIPHPDPWATVAPDKILTVTFVRAAGTTVFGRMDPYPDPVCGCELSTVFTGRITEDHIEGTYTSEHVNGGDRSTGRWRVIRTRR